MKTDKRIKGCPNPNCEVHRNKAKYQSTDQYCKICGTPLVFVCKRCYAEIPDEGIDIRMCKRCKDYLRSRRKGFQNGAKNLAAIGRDVIPDIMNAKIAKDVVVKAGGKVAVAARNIKKIK